MRSDITEKIEAPAETTVEIVDGLIKVKGPKGENERVLTHPEIKITKEGNIIKLVSKKPSKREKKMIYTFRAHIKNMIKGVVEGFVYKLRICSSHFPMAVTVENDEIVIKNLFGEKIPRRTKITPGVTVKIEGDIIVVESCDKEKAGETATRIEQATKITKRDRRIFQDGCFIIEKAGEPV